MTYSFSDSDEHSGSYDSESDSEDEWTSSDSKRKKKKKTRQPAQTLKKKLAEKTKTLRKSFESVSPAAKPTDASPVAASNETKQTNSEIVKNAEAASETGKPAVIETEGEAKEKTVTESAAEVKTAMIESEIKEKPAVTRSISLPLPKIVKVEPNIQVNDIPKLEPEIRLKEEKTDIKEEQKDEPANDKLITPTKSVKNDAVIVLSDDEDEPPPKNQPVVLNCSITKTFASPLLAGPPVSLPLSNSPLLNHLTSPPLVSSSLPTSPLINQDFVPSPLQPSNPSLISSQTPPVPNPSMIPTPVNSTPPTTPSNVCRIRVNPEFQVSPGSNVYLTSGNNQLNSSGSLSSRGRNNSLPRTPVSAPRSRAVSAQKTSYKPRKLFSERSPAPVVRSPARATMTPKRTPVARTPARAPVRLSNSISLNSISPSGSVIRRGCNSVTITPRKKSPERPPVQRKLFKNEVEGVIAARAENGVLRYVLNLANGTHLPLSNLQVQKLREQNNGVLPSKLKIPVPSDVAAQIEPSFLIED